MRPLSLSIVVSSVILACGGRTETSGASSAARSYDADAAADANALQDAESTVEVDATVDANAMVEGAASSPPDNPCGPRPQEPSCGATADAQALPKGCVTIDVSTYDRSCRTDSDCMPIAITVCPGCGCPDAAINVDGRKRYTDTIAQVPPPSPPYLVCNCPNDPAVDVRCDKGACAYLWHPGAARAR